MHIANFEEAREELNRFIPEAASVNQPYTLELMQKLMHFLGNPQDDLKIIHVAGTSGKTSTCYYLSALLAEAGMKVGTTVSPHVNEVNDRVQINLFPMAESSYCKELGKFIDLVKESRLSPSYFELLIAFAYWQFAKHKVDYAVIEVGLGGLLDGTNVINRRDKVCVITDIGLDHTKVLGSTLEAIAKQKVGIITLGNKVFANKQDRTVDEVFKQTAIEKEADLTILDGRPHSSVLDFLPSFQVRNFSLANAVIDWVLSRDGINELAEKQILNAAHTHIPGRMEVFQRQGKTIMLDGAHNAQKLNALSEAVRNQFPNQSIAVLTSFVAGGEERLETGMQAISTISKDILLTSFSGKQDTPKHSVDTDEVVKSAEGLDLNISVVQNPEKALNTILGWPQQIIVVTGSFYLLNHIRPLMLKS